MSTLIVALFRNTKAWIRPYSARMTSSLSTFRAGDKIQVEVMSFGPLGASVDVIGEGHDENSLIVESDPPLGQGIIYQREIHFFRQGRGNVDVVLGEILPAYIQKVREEDGKLDIGLRKFGLDKAIDIKDMILETLQDEPSGMIPIGDKSTPEAISEWFPGVSKSVFKKALGALYREGKVQPGSDTITLM